MGPNDSFEPAIITNNNNHNSISISVGLIVLLIETEARVVVVLCMKWGGHQLSDHLSRLSSSSSIWSNYVEKPLSTEPSSILWLYWYHHWLKVRAMLLIVCSSTNYFFISFFHSEQIKIIIINPFVKLDIHMILLKHNQSFTNPFTIYLQCWNIVFYLLFYFWSNKCRNNNIILWITLN